MIKTLRIGHFKSIKGLALNCQRINILIGQPNTGKSNILETIGMLSFLHYSRLGYGLQKFVRHLRMSNLFYDESLDYPFEIKCDGIRAYMQFKDGRYEGGCTEGDKTLVTLVGDHTNIISVGLSPGSELLSQFKSYRFAIRETFERTETDFLIPPSGDNLLSLLLANKELRAVANQPFSSMGLRLGLRPQEKKLEIVKQVEDVIVSYPYSLTSETLQRLTFYLAAILSNKKSVLVFEEPESHTFPYYTKYLAELIALDRNDNQYFISTHNPYLLLPVLEKVPKGDIAVHIVYFDNYETKTKELSEKDLEELGEVDVFSNLERYLSMK